MVVSLVCCLSQIDCLSEALQTVKSENTRLLALTMKVTACSTQTLLVISKRIRIHAYT